MRRKSLSKGNAAGKLKGSTLWRANEELMKSSVGIAHGDGDMPPVSRSSGARVRRRSKQRSEDYVDPWDIENEIYVKRLSVVETPRRASNCYYDIAGFEEEHFQNERLYDGGPEYWMQSAYGDYYYYEEEPEFDQYYRYKPTTCMPYPEGHTYEECQQKRAIYSEYIPMSSQLRRLYETRNSWRWRDLPDNNRLSVLSGYYSDEIPGDLTDDSFAPYSELRGPPPPIPASHFGLTKHGHLKIDYSCNWSSLDRFIGHSSNKSIYETKPNQVYG